MVTTRPRSNRLLSIIAYQEELYGCISTPLEICRQSLLCGQPSCTELVWNSLPAAVCEADSLYSFKHKLKTHLFTLIICFFIYVYELL